MTYITNVFHMTVEPSSLEEFKSVVAEIVELSSKEPGTLIYEYSIGEDGRSVHIVERYLTEGVLPHVEKTFGPYAERFLKLATIHTLYVYGNPPADLKAKLASFGAVFMTPFAGFARPTVAL